MWISDPTPVTTRIITAESGSSSRLNGTRKPARVDPVEAPRGPGSEGAVSAVRARRQARAARCTAQTDRPKDPSTVPQARIPAPSSSSCFLIQVPEERQDREAAEGQAGSGTGPPELLAGRRPDEDSRGRSRRAAGTRHAWRRIRGRGRAREPRSRAHHFRRLKASTSRVSLCRWRAMTMARPTAASAAATVMHEEDQHLAVEGPQRAAEGDEGQVHRVQHQLDAHEHRDDVAAQEDAHDADGEERPGSAAAACWTRSGAHGSFLARTTAPTRAARIRTDVASKT